ncbi:hypothetical protein UAW_01775 [Enterococcus haemoperoxidus ATCC BAA-382]|uniref:WxL Interacting Protein host binding domain-containing protein n=1 Tax=Enterococcus haemoperoxidus ATCC BAA-382 TaxID=1158608 RepID=R2QJP2_9ENTE|nr:hypothetical protein UAW_01775 [Enterococcus haemoperoxidus ATCC BAA-382]EOT60106.1 hypothetical protein I583_02741 [Enterococcus haemoperoxidus ATCC BAA-382]OJG51774.1 hypothetical protein RV06_GL001530 [Enterococcus haemoperoxidus]
MSIVPNTNFNFPISWDEEKIKAGTYTLNMKIRLDQENWTFTKKFYVTTQEAKKMNEKAVDFEDTDHATIYKLLVGIVLIILGSLIYLIKRKGRS